MVSYYTNHNIEEVELTPLSLEIEVQFPKVPYSAVKILQEFCYS